MIALITFGTPKQYSYFVDIEGLKQGDRVLVGTNDNYSIGIFESYTTSVTAKKNATKWVLCSLEEVIQAHEFDIEMGLK